MKLYQYTILKQDGTKEVLEPSKKKPFAELYKILNCRIIQIIPFDYYKGLGYGRCTMYGDEEGRFNSNNHRNPHFKVLKGNVNLGEPLEWDIVGNIVKEEVYKRKKEVKMDSQIMTKKELTERGFTTDKNGKVLDDFGNEYRNEIGECMYLEGKGGK